MLYVLKGLGKLWVIAGLASWWDIPWCIGGDFNVSGFPNERLGANSSPTMEEFLDIIFEQGLMDIPLQGRSFTWSNNWDSPSLYRIDRFLIFLLLESSFLGYYLEQATQTSFGSLSYSS